MNNCGCRRIKQRFIFDAALVLTKGKQAGCLKLF
jgi:hypothetical protein